MAIRRMRIECCITKATNTHSDYVMHIALPNHEWLHEGAPLLGYTYIVCFVRNSVCSQRKQHKGTTESIYCHKRSRRRWNVNEFRIHFYYFVLFIVLCDLNYLMARRSYEIAFFTYLLTPCSRALIEKLTRFSANQEIIYILWNQKFQYRNHKCPPPVPTLCQLDPVHITTFFFLKIHLNIILPTTPGSPKWSLSLRFPHQNPVYDSSLPHTCHIPRPSHSSRFYHSHNIGWAVQIIKLLIM